MNPADRREIERSYAVKHVVGDRIIYTDEFKQEFVMRLQNGEKPTAIFRSVGLGPELIGGKRIERCTAHWARGADEPSRHNRDRTKERIKRLQARLEREGLGDIGNGAEDGVAYMDDLF